MFQHVSMIAIFAIASLLFTAKDLSAQNFSGLDKSPTDIATFPKRGTDKTVKVVYGRPQTKGREVFGNLITYDKIWRTGANEATEITFYKDVKINDKVIKAKTYTIFTIPSADGKWTFILNSKLNQWGAYQYEESNDVIRIKIKAKKAVENIEAFSITFEKSKSGTIMYLGWENTILEIPIEF